MSSSGSWETVCKDKPNFKRDSRRFSAPQTLPGPSYPCPSIPKSAAKSTKSCQPASPACCASCTSGRESTMVTSSTSEKCRQLAVSVEQATLKDTSNSHAICKLCLPPRNRCSWVPCSSASHRKLYHHRAGGQDLGFSPRVPHITPLPHLLVNWARMENSGARF